MIIAKNKKFIILFSISLIFIRLFSSINLAYSVNKNDKGTKELNRNNEKRPKVGLILSGGAARGYCHIGVLSVLEEYKVPIDFIIGVSMGSIVGGYYSYGYSINQMIQIAKNFRLMSLIEINKPFVGFLSGEKLEEIFIRDVDRTNIENLKKKLYIIATDLNTQKVVVFDHGPLYIAMRASSAIPGVFDPVKYKNMVLVDGGILTDYPIKLAKKLGADVVIVSDVSVVDTMPKSKMLNMIMKIGENFIEKHKESLKKQPLNSYLNLKMILTRTMLLIEENQHTSRDIDQKDIDFLIKPVAKQIKPFDFYKVDEGYKLGREATLIIINKIVDRIKK